MLPSRWFPAPPRRQPNIRPVSSVTDQVVVLFSQINRNTHRKSRGLCYQTPTVRRNPGLDIPQRALDAIREGLRLLTWSPFSCRKAELGNGQSRELIIPFGGSGYVLLFEVVGNEVIVGAARHQREEDYRP